MEFPTPAVQAGYDRFAAMMKDLFGEFATPREEYPSFGLVIGSAYVQVALYPWGEDDVTIRTWAFVVTGVENTPELLKYLLNQNCNLRFGAYGIDEDGDVLLQHTILAKTCDKEELKASVMAIVYTADHADDEIVAKFGGQRAIDKAS